MRLISFNPYRTLNFAQVNYLKPELMNQHIDQLIAADGVLYPEYWQVNPLLYGLKKRIFPSPASYYIGHDKVEMTRCFELIAPKHVPYTLIQANTQATLSKSGMPCPCPLSPKSRKAAWATVCF